MTNVRRLWAHRAGSINKPPTGMWVKLAGQQKVVREAWIKRGGVQVSIYPLVPKTPTNLQHSAFTRNYTGTGFYNPWLTTVTWDQPASDNPVVGFGTAEGLTPELIVDPTDWNHTFDGAPLTPRSYQLACGLQSYISGTPVRIGVRSRSADGYMSPYITQDFTTPAYPAPTGVVTSLDVQLTNGSPAVKWVANADGAYVSSYNFRYKIGTGSFSGYYSMTVGANGPGSKSFTIPGLVLANNSSATFEITAIGPGGSSVPQTVTINTPYTPSINTVRWINYGDANGYMRIGLTTTDPQSQGYDFQSYHEAQGWSSVVRYNSSTYDHGPSVNYPRNFQAAYMKITPVNNKGTGQASTTGWIRKIPWPVTIDAVENDTAAGGIGGYSHWVSTENGLAGFNILHGWTGVGTMHAMSFYGSNIKNQYGPGYIGYAFTCTQIHIRLARKDSWGLNDGWYNDGSPPYNPASNPGMLPFLYLHPYPSKANVNVQAPGNGWGGGPWLSESNRLRLNETKYCILPASWGDELVRGSWYGIGATDGSTQPQYYDPNLQYNVSYRFFAMTSSYFGNFQLYMYHDA